MNALFDLDGTLCDPREGIEHGFRHAFDALGEPFPGPAAVGPLIGRPLLACFESLGLGARSAEAARHFQAFFEGRGFAEARLYPGVAGALRGLKAAGWGVAIASAKPTFAVRFVAEGLGILPWIDGLHGCGAQELSPDKRRIVGQALAALGWEPAATVMVGDRDQDRDAAAAHGLAFMGARWGFGGPGELEGALRQLDDASQLLEALRGLESRILPRT